MNIFPLQNAVTKDEHEKENPGWNCDMGRCAKKYRCALVRDMRIAHAVHMRIVMIK
jgi:hypothetical protein